MTADIPRYFDRKQLRQRRNRHAAGFESHRFLFDWTMESLADRLEDIRRDFPVALQIGSRGEFPPLPGKIGRLVTMDMAEKFLSAHIVADEEALPFAPASFDLVLSPLTLHSINDLPGALIQIRRILRPDGLFLAALPGGNTLQELRAALMEAEINIRGGVSPRVFPFADKQQMGALMQRAGFALPVVDSDIVTVTYTDMFGLMRDLRGMGESNVVAERSRRLTGRAVFAEAERLYRARFADADGRLTATFEIIFLTGWAPHESQQKPLARGSARHSLSDILE